MMRMGIFTAAAAVAALAGTATTAYARPHDFEASTQEILASQFSHGAVVLPERRSAKKGSPQRRTGRTRRRPPSETVAYTSRHSGVGPRPRRWCGWWMRTQRGGGPEFNLARNWARWGSPASPQVGAVVVWRHHVGEIVGRAANGQWIVRSGNDGGRVRSRARSLAGAIAVRM